MAKSIIGVLKNELRARRTVLQEDIDNINSGDEFDQKIYENTQCEIDVLDKILNRIWSLEHD